MTRNDVPKAMSRRHGLRAMAIVAGCAAGWVLAPGLAGAENRRTFGLEIRDGKVTAAENTIRVTEGEEVQIDWTTDKAVQLHLHGYDIEARAEPGRGVSMTFQAHTAGRFPIAAHGAAHGTVIYLEVYPR